MGITCDRIGRIAVVQAVDVGQQHQQRRADQVGDHRRQPVVVAERGLQLVDADRVVFVDDRHRAVFEQRQDRVADVQIARAVVEVVGRQQDLRGVPAVGPQRAVVGFDQCFGRPRPRPAAGPGRSAACSAQPAHARADRAGADQAHLAAGLHQLVQLFGQRRDALLVQQALGRVSTRVPTLTTKSWPRRQFPDARDRSWRS